MALMLFIFDTLNKATPEMLLRLLYPMAVLLSLIHIFSAQIAGLRFIRRQRLRLQ